MIKTAICIGVVWIGSFCGIQSAVAIEAKTQDLELEIGIIQRLGTKPIKDEDPMVKQVTINSVAGDSLKVNFWIDRLKIDLLKPKRWC